MLTRPFSELEEKNFGKKYILPNIIYKGTALEGIQVEFYFFFVFFETKNYNFLNCTVVMFMIKNKTVKKILDLLSN